MRAGFSTRKGADKDARISVDVIHNICQNRVDVEAVESLVPELSGAAVRGSAANGVPVLCAVKEPVRAKALSRAGIKGSAGLPLVFAEVAAPPLADTPVLVAPIAVISRFVAAVKEIDGPAI